MSTKYHGVIIASLACVCFTLTALSPLAVQGQIDSSQQYRKLPQGAWLQDRSAFSRIRIDVPGILRGSKDFRSGQATLDQYLKEYIFPQMTAPDDASLAQLPQRREAFLQLVQLRATDQEAHDYVVTLTMDWMEKIATLDFHPAVRYNAMLIIGEMNGVEAQLSGSPRTPPQPLAEALPLLLRELENPEQIEAVRVAALLGVHRHARIEHENSKLNRSRFNDADIRQLIDRMLAIIKAEQPPAGRSASGHAWLQCRAIEVLAEIGKVDAGGSVAIELERIVKNDKAPISLRCTAARAIGKLSFTTVQNFDAVAVARELGELAVYCCQEELNRVAMIKQEKEERELREKIAEQGPVRGRGGEGGRGQPPRRFEGGIGEGALFGGQLGVEEEKAEWQMLVSKRRLKYQLGSVLTALSGSPVPGAATQTGLLERAAPAQKASVQKLIGGVQGLLLALEADVTTQEELLKRVATKLGPLAAEVGVNNESAAEALGPAAPTEPAVGPGVPSGPGSPPGPDAPAGPDAPGEVPPAGPAPAPGPGPGGPAGPGVPDPAAPGPGGPGAPGPAAPAPAAPGPG